MSAQPMYSPQQIAAMQQYNAQMHQYPPQGYAPQYPQQQAVHTKRRQSISTHIWLACLTFGVGNVLYSKWCNSQTASKYQW